MSWLSTFYPGDSAAMSVAAYLVQMTLLLVAGLLIARRYRWDAAMRHHVLMLTWVAVAALPVLTWGFASSQVVTGVQSRLLASLPAWTTTAPTNEPAGPAPARLRALPAWVERLEIDPQPAAGRSPVPAAIDYRKAASAIGLVWLGGLLVGLVRLGDSARRLARIRRRSTEATAGSRLGSVCRQAAGELGLARVPEIRLSAECSGPVVIGLWRPAALFPKRIANTLSPEELRQVVVHEMAHVARRDYLVVWGQHLFASCFWFHPLAPRFNRALAQAREELCDNHVLARVTDMDYGHTLLNVAEAIGEVAAPRLSVGLLAETWSLESRIAQILNHRRETMTRVNWSRAFATSLGAVGVTAAMSLGSPLGAHEPSPDKAFEVVEAAENAKATRIVVTKGPDGVVENVEVIGKGTSPEVGKVIVTKGPDGKVEAVRVTKAAESPKKDVFWFKHRAIAPGDNQSKEELFLYRHGEGVPGDGHTPPAELMGEVLVELAKEDPLASDQLAKIIERHLVHAKERVRESHLHAKKVELRLLEAEAALAEEEAAKVDHKHQKKEKENDPFATDQSRVEALLEKKLLVAQHDLAVQKQKFKELAKEFERRLKLANERAKERDRERVKETPEAAERE